MAVPRVELLWFEGCPSVELARAELAHALVDLGLGSAAEIRMRRIDSDDGDTPAAFTGSPTILIDGVDVVELAGRLDPDAAGAGALHCRVYRHRDGAVAPTPDPADVREALRRAAQDSAT